MNEILLNFLALENQNVQFEIHRTLSNNKEDDDGYFFGKLPNNEEKNDYNNYSISLNERSGFEKFSYDLMDNLFLSNELLFEALVTSFERDFVDYSFTIVRDYKRSIEICLMEVEMGKQLVIIEPYFLKSERKFGFLVDFKFQMNQDKAFDRETQRLSLSLDKYYKSNRDFYKEKYEKLKLILNKIPTIEIGGHSIKISHELYNIPSKQLDKKNYIFKNNNISNSQFNGVKKFGAYQELTNSNIQFYFIFKERNKGLANDLFLSLTGKKSPGTFPGLNNMFGIKIDVDNVSRILLNDFDLDSAKLALNELDIEINKNTSRIPFVIYIEENNHEENQQALYNYFKYELLKRLIAFQVITDEKLGNQDTLKWSVSSIGLQIFSKLGGIPWLVKPSKENCLILGIGQAYGEKDDTGKISKQFAYSVCIDSTGLFKKVAILSDNLNDRESFESSITTNLRALLESPEFGNYKRCAIHIPFKIKEGVIKAIQKTAKEMSEEMDLKIIKINTKNKFFGFSTHATKVPYESSYIDLSRNEFLVWFEGLNYGKEIIYKRPASPIHVEFLNNESKISDNYNDMEYLQDILNLSGGNWRGFNAKAMPISIYYSQIIADYTLEFGGIDKFDLTVFNNSKPWFL